MVCIQQKFINGWRIVDLSFAPQKLSFISMEEHIERIFLEQKKEILS